MEILPINSKPVEILASFNGTANAVTDAKENDTDEGNSTVPFLVDRKTRLASMAETPRS